MAYIPADCSLKPEPAAEAAAGDTKHVLLSGHSAAKDKPKYNARVDAADGELCFQLIQFAHPWLKMLRETCLNQGEAQKVARIFYKKYPAARF